MTTSLSTTPVFDVRLLEFRGEVLQHLGRGGDVLVADDDRGLAPELAEFRQAGVLRRAAQEGVLDDVAAGAGAPEAVPQFGKLSDFQAGVIGDEEERRAFSFACRSSTMVAFSGCMIVDLRLVLDEGRRIDLQAREHRGAERDVFDEDALCASAGAALTTASMTAVPFSTSACGSKENLPTGTAMLPFLSSLNSTRPAFTSAPLSRCRRSRCRSSDSASGRVVRAPCRACGLPPSRPGVAIATSKSWKPPLHFSIMSL